jgi:hypothetical protein
MKNIFFVLLFALFLASSSFAHAASVDSLLLKQLEQIVNSLQKLIYSYSNKQIQQSESLTSATSTSSADNASNTENNQSVSQESLTQLLPDNNKENDVIVQLNNLRITKIINDQSSLRAKMIILLLRMLVGNV